MLDVFEYPWLLLGVSLALLMIMGTLRCVFPEKRHWCQMAIPLLVAAGAIILDVVVDTDREQILQTTKTLHVAAEQGDVNAIAKLIAPDYQDALHRNRQQLLDRAVAWISRSQIEKARKIGMAWETLESSTAVVSVRSGIVFTKDSAVARTYKPKFLIRIRLHLKKQANRRWLIQEIELNQVDGQSFGWRQLPPIP
jgi:hypothetical protein